MIVAHDPEAGSAACGSDVGPILEAHVGVMLGTGLPIGLCKDVPRLNGGSDVSEIRGSRTVGQFALLHPQDVSDVTVDAGFAGEIVAHVDVRVTISGHVIVSEITGLDRDLDVIGIDDGGADGDCGDAAVEPVKARVHLGTPGLVLVFGPVPHEAHDIALRLSGRSIVSPADLEDEACSGIDLIVVGGGGEAKGGPCLTASESERKRHGARKQREF